MKTKTVILLAILLGLFTYTLPLYAAGKEHHIEEITVIDIPVVGKISTRTTSYLAGCKLKEVTTIKLHNALVQMLSESDGKSHDNQLSDMCEELLWKYDDEKMIYTAQSFSEIRAKVKSDLENSETQIDMESDQNDIDDLPRVVREIMGYEKNINGFKAQKVLTTVYPEDSDKRIVIEEYYTNKSQALSKISSAREDLNKKLGYDDAHIEGVPSLINMAYNAIKTDRDWSRPDGEVIKFTIKLLDDDEDEMFTMTYDVTTAETIPVQEDHFALK